MQEYELNASTSSTAEVLGYRQRLEKPAGGDIALMEWSPTMDLLAATFVDNSVSILPLSSSLLSSLTSFLRAWFSAASRTRAACTHKTCGTLRMRIYTCSRTRVGLAARMLFFDPTGNRESVIVAASVERHCTEWHSYCTSMET